MPVLAQSPQRVLSVTQRVLAAIVAALCLSLLLLAAYLTPSTAGHGTHRQLGLPECGWVTVLNKPCPTCGMTTAVTLAAHGRLVEGFVAQPAGVLVGLGVAVAFWVAAHAAATGCRSHAMFGFLIRPRVLWILGAIWLGSWGYKIWTWPG